MTCEHPDSLLDSHLVPLLMCVRGVVSILCQSKTPEGKTTILVVMQSEAFHPASSAVLAIYTGCMVCHPQFPEFELKMRPLRSQTLPTCLDLEGEWEVLA